MQPHHLSTMQLRRLFFVVLLALPAVLGVQPVRADPPAAGGTTTVSSSDLYTSPQGAGGLPSGAINVTPGDANMGADAKAGIGLGTYTSASTAPGDTTNLLGCGGVGQGEYTSALYNMPENFPKFQQDVDSNLAHQMLVMNYIMPQTAALFDQLNTYGNQRYQQFQKGCNVTALQQDARNQYINTCVAQQVPLRLAIITQQTQAGSGSGNQQQGTQMTADMKNAQAYAQAWEICANGSISDTTALAARKKALDDFAKQERALENVTAALKPLVCPPKGSDTKDQGCWQALLLPQVRVCIDNSLGCTGNTTVASGYGVKEPLLPMARLFDALRYMMDDIVVARRAMPFQGSMLDLHIPDDVARDAAREAAISMSSAAVYRNINGLADTTANTSTGAGGVGTVPPASVADFQISYLNCTQPDILFPIRQFATTLNARLAAIKPAQAGNPSGGQANATAPASITVSSLDATNFSAVVTRLATESGDAGSSDSLTADRKSLQDLAWVGLGCTANQTVPIFDPNITASLKTCPADDTYAFYAMSEYDVSLAATRDIYRFLSLRMKQVYTQLLTQTAVLASTTIAGQPSPTVSPELNNRMAAVVKEIMIPYIDSQITRLDDLNRSRGDFGRRVQHIYETKSGCMFTNSLAGVELQPGHGPH